MATCEKCGKEGWLPAAMAIAEDKYFVGPCCADASTRPVQQQSQTRPVQVINLPPPGDAEYGLELSNKVGVRAYVNYNGLSLQFEKSPSEIRELMEEAGITEKRKAGSR